MTSRTISMKELKMIIKRVLTIFTETKKVVVVDVVRFHLIWLYVVVVAVGLLMMMVLLAVVC